jgi:hypothetical protein
MSIKKALGRLQQKHHDDLTIMWLHLSTNGKKRSSNVKVGCSKGTIVGI